MPPWFQVDYNSRISPGKIHKVMLNELPNSLACTVILAKFDGYPLALLHESTNPVCQWGIYVSWLEEEVIKGITRAHLINVVGGIRVVINLPVPRLITVNPPRSSCDRKLI